MKFINFEKYFKNVIRDAGFPNLALEKSRF